MLKDPFIRDLDDYKQNLNVSSNYLDSTAFYISRTKGIDFHVARQKIKEHISQDSYRAKIPTIRFFQRDPETLDVSTEETSLTEYLRDVAKHRYTITPSFTCYLNYKERPSKLVGFAELNKKLRSIIKNEGKQAEAEGKHEIAAIKDIEQNNKKTYNNALSGMFAAIGSVLRNPSAHSSLTSTTRTVTSLSNTNNEKMIAGNRYYPDIDTILENIAAICIRQNMQAVETVMNKYGLHYPSVEETLDVIYRSSSNYMYGSRNDPRLVGFLKALKPVELAAFCYTSDLYHIRVYNEEFIKNFFKELITPPPDLYVEECDYVKVLSSLDEGLINFVHQLHTDKLQGVGKKHNLLEKSVQREIYTSYKNTERFFNKYADLIGTFFASDVLPSRVSEIQCMVRKTVLVSDTDSTMFSLDEWVNWYCGKLVFNRESYGLAAAVGLVVTQTIKHTLAAFSAQLNVDKSHMRILEMKPEFVFPVFATTAVSKHYFASIKIREGNVFSENKIEIKGVHLKNSALPKKVVKEAQDIMKDILHTVETTGKITIMKYVRALYDKEQEIIDSVLKGNIEYLRFSKIRDKEAYSADPERSPYANHEFWVNNVTGYLNNFVPTVPYDCVKVPLSLSNRTKLKVWLDGIQDKQLAKSIGSWLVAKGKSDFKTMHIPYDHVLNYGVPDFIKPAINFKRIVLDNTTAFRLALQSLRIPLPDGVLLTEWVVSNSARYPALEKLLTE